MLVHPPSQITPCGAPPMRAGLMRQRSSLELTEKCNAGWLARLLTPLPPPQNGGVSVCVGPVDMGLSLGLNGKYNNDLAAMLASPDMDGVYTKVAGQGAWHGARQGAML